MTTKDASEVRVKLPRHRVVFTRTIGKGPPPAGWDKRRWKKHGENLRRIERLTGVAPLTADGWETAAVVLMNILENKNA